MSICVLSVVNTGLCLPLKNYLRFPISDQMSGKPQRSGFGHDLAVLIHDTADGVPKHPEPAADVL